MTSQEKLIAFMEMKQSLLPIKEPAYFTEKDADAIRKWDDASAKRIVLSIKKALNGMTAYDLNCAIACTCPFCVRYGRLKNKYDYSELNINCEKCEYAVHHGICDTEEDEDEPSTWNILGNYMSDLLLNNRAELLAILEAK